MTAAEYRAALKALGLTQVAAAALLCASPRTGRAWAAEGPSPLAAKFLRLMLARGIKPEEVI